MKKFIKLFTLSLSSILLLASCSTGNSTSNNNSSNNSTSDHNLVVYAVNDTHGKIEDDPSNSIAGLAKIREYIYADDDYDPNYSVIVSAGDMFQGSGLSNLTLGKAMTEVMNSFPFDAMTIGNHEFDWGLNELFESIESLRTYELLACNIIEKSTNKLPEGVLPSTTVTKGDYKIGIVGSIQSGIDSSIAYNKVKDYNIVYDADLVIEEAKDLKKDGCDFVIYVGHQGETSSVDTISKSGDVDLAILGHTHALINETVRVGSKTVPVLEASADAKSFSKTIFNKNGYVSHSVKTFSQTEIRRLTLSSELQDIINKYNEQTAPLLNEKIATVDGPLTRYQVSGSGSLPVLITKTLYEYGLECELTNVIGVHNTAGIRANFTKDSYPADMTYGDIYTFSPFDNEVRYVTLKGDKVASAIANHHFYPTLSSLILHDDEDYNIVTIDYLTTSPGYPLYAEDGGKYPGGENYVIRDLLKDKWQEKGTINIADYPFNR